MNTKPSGNTLAFFLVALLTSAVFPLVSFAVGQMTEPIVIADALRGQKISDKITLINSENEKKNFQIKAEGAIKDWATFYQLNDPTKLISEVEVAPAFYHSIGVDFNVPSDVPNGIYKGTIDVIFSPEKSMSDRTATVNTSVSRPVSITVSDKEVVDVQASIVAISYTVKSGAPAQIRVTYDNNSNIAIKPSVQLKIANANFNAIFPYPDNMEAVKAGEHKEMPLIEWQTAGQSLGDYLAEVSILVNGQTVKTEKITFRIQNTGIAGMADISKIGGNDLTNTIMIGALIFAVLILVAVFILKRKKMAGI